MLRVLSLLWVRKISRTICCFITLTHTKPPIKQSSTTNSKAPKEEDSPLKAVRDPCLEPQLKTADSFNHLTTAISYKSSHNRKYWPVDCKKRWRGIWYLQERIMVGMGFSLVLSATINSKLHQSRKSLKQTRHKPQQLDHPVFKVPALKMESMAPSQQLSIIIPSTLLVEILFTTLDSAMIF